MRLEPSSLLRGLGTLVMVVVASVVVSIGLGLLLSRLSGTAGSAAPATARPLTTATTAAPEDGGGAAGTAPRVRVLSSTFAAATGPTGRARQRARVTVRLSATASGSEARLGPALLVSGSDEVESDPNAEAAAGELLLPIAAGETATGALRFETAGAVTARLGDERRATLMVGDRSIPLRLTVR